MSEHPILMSGEMVRAILDGRKTQTRRVILPQPLDTWMKGPDWSKYYVDGQKNLWIEHPTKHTEIKCPYGVPGDTLWVRETWWGANNGKPYRNAIAPLPTVVHRANDTSGTANRVKWRPSIHMPRWASRLTLDVVKLRVERVQEISEEDAIAEGVSGNGVEHGPAKQTARYRYHVLWDRINAKRGYVWASNPWVWVIEFQPKEVA